MIASTHITASAASGLILVKILKNCVFAVKIPLVFAAGLISHLVLDCLPHSEKTIYRNKKRDFFWLILSLEIILSLFFVLIAELYNNNAGFKSLVLISSSVFGGVLFDVPHVLGRFNRLTCFTATETKSKLLGLVIFLNYKANCVGNAAAKACERKIGVSGQIIISLISLIIIFIL